MLGEVSNCEASKKFNSILCWKDACFVSIELIQSWHIRWRSRFSCWPLCHKPGSYRPGPKGCRMVWCLQSCPWWWRWRPRLRLIQDVMYTSFTWPFHCYISLHLRTLSSAWSLVCTSHCTVSLPKRRTGRTRTRQLRSSSCGPLGQQNCGNYDELCGFHVFYWQK